MIRLEREETIGDYTARIIIEVDHTLTDDAIRLLREAWAASYTGPPKEDPVVVPVRAEQHPEAE